MYNKKLRLQIVLKFVERCNINCTYCYVFNGENEDWKRHPPYMKANVVNQVIKFLQQGCAELDIDYIRIIFHGGEPLMYKKRPFDELCNGFKDALPSCGVCFSLQTNAMLVDNEWIELFHKHNIGVGISLDGPKEYHDIDRVDHRGYGTYDRVVKGLRLLQEAARNKLINHPGVLTVINPKIDAKKIYRHFVDELNIKSMDFLLPDITCDTIEREQKSSGWQIADFGTYICDIFNEWTKDDNPNIDVRVIDIILRFLLGTECNFANFGVHNNDNFVFGINSDGTLGADAVLTNTNAFNNIGNVFNTSLREFLYSDGMRRSNPYLDQSTLSPVCSNCHWVKLCNGGTHINRYSNKNGFANPSIFCDALQMIYERIAEYALNNGLSIEALRKRLEIKA
ncbi:MAG: radical SAM protein [Wolbachia endosymbiont of Tyrophagus putrescentiae]|nr:radical SAM protein [Wolbachia endosymbiont of Tyrophagus putrescentiae]MDN5249154.1 radical SAM protein [Alphaproteobacteria bacterium]